MTLSISVVIPAHNAHATIGDALDSVLRQSHSVEQIIVVDDGSTDDTAAIAASYGSRVTVVTQANAGPSAARNHGIALVTSELTAFLDDDDVWHPRKLERQLRVLEEDPTLDLVATTWTRTMPSNPPESPPHLRSEDLLPYVTVLVLNRFQTSTVLARTDRLKANGGFAPELDGVEDWEFWLRFSQHGKMGLLQEPLTLYRDSPNGVSKDLTRFYRTMRIMLERESGSCVIDRELFNTIRTWHQLRMTVGFLTIGAPAMAVTTLRDLQRDGLAASAPTAFRRYLYPFLRLRAKRRAAVLRRRSYSVLSSGRSFLNSLR